MSDKTKWAWKAASIVASEAFSSDGGTTLKPIAYLLIATREAALREAASVCAKSLHHRASCSNDEHAILALIDKEPAS